MKQKIRVLIVCSGNSGKISPFILEQAKSLKKLDIQIEYFPILGNGLIGYLSNYFRLRKLIRKGNYNLIHAHYGYSGLLSILQRKTPVITTFHGSDINEKRNRIFSIIASRLSAYNIFVHPVLPSKIKFTNKKKYNVIPCGVNTAIFKPSDKNECRKKLGLSTDKDYILFSSSFDNPIKNYTLARRALEILNLNIELLELKEASPLKVSFMMNAVDLLLVTSTSETGPLVVKEAMACNCPIVCTDVGDVKEIIRDTEGCFITSFDPNDVAKKIEQALAFGKRTCGREQIPHFELSVIAKKIIAVYKGLIK